PHHLARRDGRRHPRRVLAGDVAVVPPAASRSRGGQDAGRAAGSPVMSEAAVVTGRSAAADYVELTKPRITLMVVLTAFVGYALASTGSVFTGRLAAALLGTALVAAGASCLNMLLERRTDSLMLRTRNRPLPAGRLRAPETLAWGLALTTSGLAVLAWRTGALAAAVAFVTWASYLFFYTPLKTRTS